MSTPRPRLRPQGAGIAAEAPPPVPLQFTDRPPADPELQKLTEDVLNSLKYAFTAAAAELPVARPGEMDGLFRKFVSTRPAAKRAAFRKEGRRILAASATSRRSAFGRFGQIDPAEYSRIGSDGLVRSVGELRLDPRRVVAAAEGAGSARSAFIQIPPEVIQRISVAAGEPAATSRPRLNLSGMAEAYDKAQGAKFTRLRLVLREVECIKTTSGMGTDEIAMGGLLVDPSGTTKKINEFFVGKNFDAGVKKSYPGGKTFAEWKIVSNGNWPQVYPSMLVMVEKDNGGFSDFLAELWKWVKEYVEKAIMAAGAAAGAAIGAAIGTAFAGIGVLIGAVAGFLVGAFVGWLIAAWKDDLIQVHSQQLHLGAATASYYAAVGLTNDPPKPFALNFKGDGGHYRVRCHYQVVE
jgi:hypothetical protein